MRERNIISIPMTNRPEVHVDEYALTQLARVIVTGPGDRYALSVRRHNDGRVFVWGFFSAAPAYRDCRGGEVLKRRDDIPAAIRRVGEYCQVPDSVIRECIADLPAEEI